MNFYIAKRIADKMAAAGSANYNESVVAENDGNIIVESEESFKKRLAAFVFTMTAIDTILQNLDKPITIIMRGMSGSGKSTVAIIIMKYLKKLGIDVEIHCTDDCFMVGDIYDFVESKLGKYHMKTLEKYKNSSAQIKIVANTNLNKSDYKKYSHGMIIELVLNIPESVKIASKRNVHNVPIKTLEIMFNKHKEIIKTLMKSIKNQ